MSNFRQTGQGRECGPILNPQYQHESVEGNVVLEFNVSRFIPKIINNHLGKKIRVVKWRWHQNEIHPKAG